MLVIYFLSDEVYSYFQSEFAKKQLLVYPFNRMPFYCLQVKRFNTILGVYFSSQANRSDNASFFSLSNKQFLKVKILTAYSECTIFDNQTSLVIKYTIRNIVKLN